MVGPCYTTGSNTGPNLGDPKRGHNFDNPPYLETVVTRLCILQLLAECIRQVMWVSGLLLRKLGVRCYFGESPIIYDVYPLW